jgi:L-lactate dehydrogenase complex protein LldG
MSARDDILNAVRNGASYQQPLPQVPDFASPSDDLVSLFTTALGRLDGKVIPEPPSGVQQWLSTAFPDARRICSAASEVSGNVGPAGFSDWAAPAEIDVMVMRTPLGVAETGSILVTENEVDVTTSAVLAQHLVVLLDPATIVENLHLAYRHPAFQAAAYAVLLSGPSGSADIGGVTVHPAQGVTTLTVVLSPRDGTTQITTAISQPSSRSPIGPTGVHTGQT